MGVWVRGGALAHHWPAYCARSVLLHMHSAVLTMY